MCSTKAPISTRSAPRFDSMTLIEIASLFEARKGSVIDATGLDKDALHIYFGLAVFQIGTRWAPRFDSMTLIEIASLFEARKGSVIDATGLDKDALHIYFGLAVFLAVRLVWRWRGGWVAAWLVVLAMACGGEWLDL